MGSMHFFMSMVQVLNLPSIRHFVDRLPEETREQTLKGIELAVDLHQVCVSAPCADYTCLQVCCVLAFRSTRPRPSN